MHNSSSFIKIRRLARGYSEGEQRRVIFANLNLDIERGAFIALLGQSGSGKSTLLNLLGGIDLPDAGRIEVNGQVLTDLHERGRTRFRRRHIGFVFQFFNLIPTLTAEENLLLPLELNRLATGEQRDRALELLDNIGLGDRRSSFPEQLSGGEQQRLAIVRALVHDPLLLLADEPTGNLDAETGERILELLLKLHRQAGTTIIMVTHSREVATRADRILVLEAGHIRERSR
ncbi:MAG: ABC transporter ATP-binding protein [Candidatus Competibacteraceae bacterium]|nr:ABC transporter ATP-binding protein [Candidatus Competibacteraceae bacterium]HRY15452.1 ABC transporter ATP-binding protein [Candidatus Competibacteraceae bacterium]